MKRLPIKILAVATIVVLTANCTSDTQRPAAPPTKWSSKLTGWPLILQRPNPFGLKEGSSDKNPAATQPVVNSIAGAANSLNVPPAAASQPVVKVSKTAAGFWLVESSQPLYEEEANRALREAGITMPTELYYSTLTARAYITPGQAAKLKFVVTHAPTTKPHLP